MLRPAASYLKEYRVCLKKQRDFREQIGLPKNDEEDREFSKKYYELYVAKLFCNFF